MDPITSLLASGGSETLPPLWSVLPFVFILLGIALLPLFAHHWWESNRNRAIFSFGIAIPSAFYWVSNFGWPGLLHEWQEYISFIALLGSLYVASGGIYLRANLTPGPRTNVMICLVGAVIANLVGTTGASMLLIRPYLKANAHRPMAARVRAVVFFIFMVSNIGGCLTPLGDPPLFLGFLKGVPFEWTFQLWREWAFMLGILLVFFYVWDRFSYARETHEPIDEERHDSTGIDGKRNAVLLLCIMGAVLCKGIFGWPFGVQEGIMFLVAAVSMAATPRELRRKNKYTWGPILEVAILFAGIFTVMVAPLEILRVEGASLGLTEPWQYFWITGTLSSFLDNAPTYLVFGQTAASQAGVESVGGLVTAAPHLLVAISIGAVFMGANTYIGNGPNFMVKAIAEENNVQMPSFFGYMRYSITILVPLFVLVTLVFLL